MGHSLLGANRFTRSPLNPPPPLPQHTGVSASILFMHSLVPCIQTSFFFFFFLLIFTFAVCYSARRAYRGEEMVF